MPHLSPMKWFHMFTLMMMGLMIFSIQLHFFFFYKPSSIPTKNYFYQMKSWTF